MIDHLNIVLRESYIAIFNLILFMVTRVYYAVVYESFEKAEQGIKNLPLVFVKMLLVR